MKFPHIQLKTYEDNGMPVVQYRVIWKSQIREGTIFPEEGVDEFTELERALNEAVTELFNHE